MVELRYAECAKVCAVAFGVGRRYSPGLYVMEIDEERVHPGYSGYCRHVIAGCIATFWRRISSQPNRYMEG